MRKQLTKKQITDAMEIISEKLQYRLIQKGFGTFASRHEVLGVVTEEYKEFIDAVHSKNYNEMCEEIIDLAVACIFGFACINEQTIEW